MKAFFLTRQLREKLLLLGLVLIAALMWLSAVSGRVKTFWNTAQITSSDLSDQRRWLAERTRIESDAKTAAARLDAARTFDSVRLQAELDSIAHAAGIGNTSINDTKVIPGPQFSINSVHFVVRNVDWNSLKRFYLDLASRAPYIGIEEFSLMSGQADPNQLTASLRVSSVEITH